MAQRLLSQDSRLIINWSKVEPVRLLDLLLCLLALPWLLPLFGLLALLVKLSSPGSVFYRAKRVGQHGQPFAMYKFRTMYEGSDRKGPGVTVNQDPRVTPIGRILRRFKLDELPQLINILKGEMSLVGPRPEDPRYVAYYSEDQRQLLSIRPGLTSPASLYYSQEETLLSGANWETTYIECILPQKLAIDLAFAQHYTVQNYLAVLLATVVAVLRMPRFVEILLKLRNRHVLLLDLFLLLVTPTVALAFRLDLPVWSIKPDRALIFYTVLALLVKEVVFYLFGLYTRYWRYASISDLGRIISAVGVTTALLFSCFTIFYHYLDRVDLAIYRSLPLLDGLLTAVAVGGVRFSFRLLNEWQRKYRALSGNRRVLIVGAGSAGTMVLDEIKANPELDMAVVAFIDDDRAKIGTHVQGVPVVGSTDEIAAYVAEYFVDRIIVAMPSAARARLRKIVEQCGATGLETYSLPGMYELLAGYKTVNPVPKVDLNQLLKRPPILADKTEIGQVIVGSTVLVTGAGGSIGRELCRQIAQLKPGRLILLGHGENSIFEIGMELRLAFPDVIFHQVIADVRDAKRINQVIDYYRPKVIYHAAAHKHVPLMQINIEEVITNNVLGTRTVLRAAEQHNVEYFVLISTDKAINPTSMMGASKRLAELLVEAAAKRTGRTYKAVRFGNVLGSRGSVIPIFQSQIAAGGPITITHPEMTRYFMTIPEAVQLVLQATVLGRSGEIFVLDMGQPVRIVDLAEGLIQMSGAKPGEIDIVFSGIRPGEKLFEELFQPTEQYERTKYEKIFAATENGVIAHQAIEEAITQLIGAAQQLATEEVLRQIKQIIPTYQPEANLPAASVGQKPDGLNSYPRQRELKPVPAA